MKSDVYLKSDNLTPNQIREAHLHPVDDISETVSKLMKDKGNTVWPFPRRTSNNPLYGF
ncbi:MAG: hypothetical protein CM1200mP3_13970 [Chloroflexota bacterium]|nr:MAG: hypothetical protein CM1200mP3_13970 [Chloroflexota bacterium]